MISHQIKNPYEPFTFAPANFVGRDEILRYLRNRVTHSTPEYENSKHVVLLGDGGTGKTWLLLKYLDYLPEKKFFKIYLDIGNYIEDIDGFISDFQEQAHFSPKAKFSLTEFAKSISIGFPIGVSVNPGDLFIRDVPIAINQKLQNLSVHLIELAREAEKPVVLALDQYGLIAQMKGGAHVVRQIANLMRETNHSKLSNLFVITALRPEHKGILEFPYGDEIFNTEFMDRYSVGTFSMQEAIRAIQQPVELIDKQFNKQTIQSILAQIKEPNPYYLQLACRLIWDYETQNKTEIPDTIINLSDHELQEILSQGQVSIFQRFSAEQKEILKILATSHPIPLTAKQINQRLENVRTESVVGNLERVLTTLVNHAERPLRYIETLSAYRINHDLFADHILNQYCAPEEYDAAVLQGLLEYLPGLFRISQFVLDETLLDRLWTFRHRLKFTDEMFEVIARSILILDDEKWEVYFQWFSAYGSKFTNVLTNLLRNTEEKRFRLGIIKGMAKTGDLNCSESLIGNLADESSDIRKAIIEALGELRADRVANSLIGALGDEDEDVQEAAALVLGELKLEIAVPALEKLLISGPSRSVIDSAINAIIQIGNNSARVILTKLIKSGPEKTRIAAIERVVDLPHKGTGRVLIEQLRKKDEDIKLKAIKSLGKLKDAETISNLAKRLLDKSTKIAEATINALGEFKYLEAKRYLIGALSNQNPVLRSQAFLVLKSNLMADDVSQIMPDEKDKEWVRLYKIRLLARIGTEEALKRIRFYTNDESELVRAEFVRNLYPFSYLFIQTDLAKSFQDISPLVRKVAVQTSSHFLDDISDVVFEPLLQDSDKTVKWLAQRIYSLKKKGKKVISAFRPEENNYGWRFMEASYDYSGGLYDRAALVLPVAEYGRGEGCSVTGGQVYRGQAFPEWQGVYLYGDFCSGNIWGLLKTQDGFVNSLLFRTNFQISTFGLDDEGEIYVASYSGAVYRLSRE